MRAVITINHRGDFNKLEKFFQRIKEEQFFDKLNKYGQMGVDALASATPVDSGTTANSWSYEIRREDAGPIIYWSNSNINKGVNIALILQTGHGTRNGGYVQGRDYINPAIQPVFDTMLNELWEEVVNS